jgi:hypothetical protein
MSDNLKITFLGGGLLLSSSLFIYYCNNLIHLIKTRSKLTKAKEHNVNSLILLAESGDGSLFNKRKTENDVEIKSKGEILVKGLADTNDPLPPMFDPSSQLIFRRVYIRDIYSNDININNDNHVDQYLKSQESTYFHLSDEGNPVTHCKIYRKSDLEIVDCLEMIGSKDFVKPLNIFQKILSGIYLLFSYLFLLKKEFFNIKGIKIGYSEEEFGIRAGGIFTLLGEVVYNFQLKNLRIENPLVIMKSKEDYVRSFNLKIIKYFALAMLTGITSLILYKFFKPLAQRRYREKNKKSANFNKMNSVISVYSGAEKFLCLNCKDKNCAIIFKPCLHVVFCKKCFEVFQSQECPVCKAFISETAEILLP